MSSLYPFMHSQFPTRERLFRGMHSSCAKHSSANPIVHDLSRRGRNLVPWPPFTIIHKPCVSNHAIKIYNEQECIPVGCVPAARRPYAGVCFPGGSALGGVCSGGCLVWGEGGSAPGGGGWRGGGWREGGRGMGVLGRGGGWVSQHALRQTPLPPVDRHTPMKILPWPNFVAAGKKDI